MKAIVLSRRKIIASLFFILAVLIGFYGTSYYYLASKYPTSAQYIERNLNLPEVANVIKVEEAKKEGYSEKEIAEYLAKTNLEKLDRYTDDIVRIELTIFLVALFVAAGLIVLTPNAKSENS